ncbi:MAG: AMP-binding protein [Myxococcota bacterium]
MRTLTDASGTTAIPNPIESAAIARPHHPALLTDDGDWSAHELRDAVSRAAASLIDQGLSANNRIGLIGPPSAEWVIAGHAIGWIGASVVPLPHDQPAAEIKNALVGASPHAVVSTRGFDSAQRNELARDFERPILEMSALRSSEAEEAAERFWPWTEERASLLTSGTTGASQAVSLTTAQMVMSSFASSLRIGHHLDDRWLLCLPLHHVGGFSVLLRAALGATTMVLHPRFVATRVAQALDSGEITLVSLVPTMMERILEVRGDGVFPNTLRAILLGGAGTSPELLERCREVRAPVALTWGMTEAASQIATRFAGDLSPDTGSGPPLAFSRVRREASGTLTVYGPTVGGVHRTRDLGSIDESHRVHISGRRDDTIVSGGENIAPSEVESILRANPGVRDAIVVAIPDTRWGERPLALLISNAEGPVEDDELREWCRERLASFKVPDHFLWVDEIPLGPLGKRPRSRARSLAQSLAPELFSGDDTQPGEGGEQLIGDGAGAKRRTVDHTVNQRGVCTHAVFSVRQTVAKRQRAFRYLGQHHVDPNSVAMLDRTLKVGFGVNQGSSPTRFRSGPSKRVGRVAKGRRQHFLERLVAKLEDSAKENDANLVHFVETSRDLVLKPHAATSRLSRTVPDE